MIKLIDNVFKLLFARPEDDGVSTEKLYWWLTVLLAFLYDRGYHWSTAESFRTLIEWAGVRIEFVATTWVSVGLLWARHRRGG